MGVLNAVVVEGDGKCLSGCCNAEDVRDDTRMGRRRRLQGERG